MRKLLILTALLLAVNISAAEYGPDVSVVRDLSVGGNATITGSLAVDSPTLQVNAATNTVTIGGAATVTGSLTVDTTVANSPIFSIPRPSNSTIKAFWAEVDSSDNTVLKTSNSALYINTKWNVSAPDNTMTLTHDGNVGIGCTPSYLLDVNGYAGIGGLRIKGTDYENTIWQSTADQNLSITLNSTSASKYVRLGTSGNSTTGLFVTGSGNVGIGTASPTPTTSGSLDVHGYTCLGDGSPAIKIKKLSTTPTGISEGATVSLAHGLTLSKIISVTSLVGPATVKVHPNMTDAGYQYQWYIDGTNVTIQFHATNSENIINQPIVVTIIYEE